jgi:transposase
VSRVNARQVRDYARATGRLAKTDKLDALVLAEYGSVLKPQVTRKTPEQQGLLQDCTRRREQIVCLIRQEKHALEHLDEKQLAEMARQHISFLEGQLCTIDERIGAIVATDKDMSQRYKILTSCKGIGFVTAITLIADMPELGTIDHKKAAALAGLAPHNHDSGQYRGQRHISGGRKNVRQALYMAALSASLFNPPIKAFKNKLKNKGKSGKCSNIACARKLLLTLNALLRENRLWRA